MRKISKRLAVVATVMAIGGTGLVAVAQTGGPGYAPPGFGMMGGGYGMMGGGHGMMGAWGAGFADPATRLDALKTALAIRPEQTGAWDAYAKAVRDGVTQMQAMRDSIDFDKLQTMSWQDHLAYMGQFHDRQAAALRPIQTAKDALLAVLDDSQKSRLLSSGPGYLGPRMMGWYGGSPAMGPGYGMMMWGPGGTR